MNRNRTAFAVAAILPIFTIGVGTLGAESAKAAPSATHAQVAKPHPFSTRIDPPARARWMKVPCKYEDSDNCSWNAQQAGNHVGHSFYAVTRPLENVHGVTIGRVTCVYYVKMADHKWDACHIRNW